MEVVVTVEYSKCLYKNIILLILSEHYKRSRSDSRQNRNFWQSCKDNYYYW